MITGDTIPATRSHQRRTLRRALERVLHTLNVQARRGPEREGDGGGEHRTRCPAQGVAPRRSTDHRAPGNVSCRGAARAGALACETTRMPRSSPSGAQPLQNHEDVAFGEEPPLAFHRPAVTAPLSLAVHTFLPEYCLRLADRGFMELESSSVSSPTRVTVFQLPGSDEDGVRPLRTSRTGPVPESGRPSWWCRHRTGSRSSGSVRFAGVLTGEPHCHRVGLTLRCGIKPVGHPQPLGIDTVGSVRVFPKRTAKQER
jgi:hypothetical protein